MFKKQYIHDEQKKTFDQNEYSTYVKKKQCKYSHLTANYNILYETCQIFE